MFKLLFLGTGTSVGVPLIGCTCPVCTSADPHDNRRRSAVYITLDAQALQIDTPPDFRDQALRFKLPRVDAVAITHLHADHIFGFDDVRRFNTIQHNQVINTYAHPETLKGMKRIFNYISSSPTDGLYRPLINFIPQDKTFETLGARITPLPVLHGHETTQGYRVDYHGKSVAYIPDCHEIPETTLDLMHDLDCVILDGLRHKEHKTHLTFERAFAYFARIQAHRSYLTHMSHDILHVDLEKILPPNNFVAYDGLELTFEP